MRIPPSIAPAVGSVVIADVGSVIVVSAETVTVGETAVRIISVGSGVIVRPALPEADAFEVGIGLGLGVAVAEGASVGEPEAVFSSFKATYFI